MVLNKSIETIEDDEEAPFIYIAEWAKYRGLRQVQVCQAAGVSKSTGSKWFNDGKVRAKNLVRLSKVFNCNIGELFYPPPDKSGVKTLPSPPNTKNIQPDKIPVIGCIGIGENVFIFSPIREHIAIGAEYYDPEQFEAIRVLNQPKDTFFRSDSVILLVQSIVPKENYKVSTKLYLFLIGDQDGVIGSISQINVDGSLDILLTDNSTVIPHKFPLWVKYIHSIRFSGSWNLVTQTK